MRKIRNTKLLRRLFCLMLAGLMLSSVFSGCRKTGDTGQTEDPAKAENILGAGEEQTAESSPEESASTEESTEEQTESPYNEDGTRRAWISAEGRLNVREKASASSQFIGSFPARQEIRVLDETPVKGFYMVSGRDYVTGNEITGYASEKYISFDPPEAPQVKLDVVSYLQTDERWGDVLLGSTKKTMYDIGCATTALAMSESFLKGEEIYPDQIAENAIYTSDGEIGWPKDYYWNYTKDMYLDFVYNKLHEGIPVLIGCTRYNGRPHWVLITGYVGDGEKLKAKDFLINDPLPYGRTNLQQYLDEYPVFSKLIYYCGDRALVPGSEESKAAVSEAAASEAAASKAAASEAAAKETEAKKKTEKEVPEVTETTLEEEKSRPTETVSNEKK